jgi:hypothetical protein
MAESLDDATWLSRISPAIEICPHYEHYNQSVVHGHIPSLFDFRNGTLDEGEQCQPDLSALLTKYRPWVSLIAQLISNSYIPLELQRPIALSWLPRIAHTSPALDDILPPDISQQQNTTPHFPSFPKLPAELRVAIWEFATYLPPITRDFCGQLPEYEPENVYPRPLNWMQKRCLPKVAHVCRESRAVVFRGGSYWWPSVQWGEFYQPFWFAHQDIIFMESACAQIDDSIKQFLMSRETIAITSRWFISDLERGDWDFLQQSTKLKKIILVERDASSRIARDSHHGVDCCGELFTNKWLRRKYMRRDRHLWHLVTYDDVSELKKVDEMWKQTPLEQGYHDSEPLWIKQDDIVRENLVRPTPIRQPWPRLRGSSIYGSWYGLRCVECEVKRFEETTMKEAQRAWTSRIMEGGEASQRVPIFTGAIRLEIQAIDNGRASCYIGAGRRVESPDPRIEDDPEFTDYLAW